jgi:hypothetical protein
MVQRGGVHTRGAQTAVKRSLVKLATEQGIEKRTRTRSINITHQRCADSGDTFAQIIHEERLVLDRVELQAMLEPNACISENACHGFQFTWIVGWSAKGVRGGKGGDVWLPCKE